jgi:hypothetical protein
VAGQVADEPARGDFPDVHGLAVGSLEAGREVLPVRREANPPGPAGPARQGAQRVAGRGIEEHDLAAAGYGEHPAVGALGHPAGRLLGRGRQGQEEEGVAEDGDELRRRARRVTAAGQGPEGERDVGEPATVQRTGQGGQLLGSPRPGREERHFGRSGPRPETAGRPNQAVHAEATQRRQQERRGDQRQAPPGPARGWQAHRRGPGDPVGLVQVGQVLAEQVGHFRRRLEPPGGVLGVQPGDDRFQPVGDVRVERAHGRRRLLAHQPQHLRRAVGLKRRPAGTKRVQHAAQAEQVGAVVHLLAAGLLGRHVQRGPGDVAGPRQAHVVRRPGEAEVRELHAPDAVLQQDVARLDVAVDQPLRVRGRQPLRRLQADAEHLHHLDRAAPLEALVKRLPADVIHHKVGDGAVVRDGVDGDDVLVADGGRGLGLPDEAPPGGVAGRQVRGRHLDGHDPAQLFVEGAEDDAHAAPSQHLPDVIVVQPAERARLPRGGQEGEVVPGPPGPLRPQRLVG